MIPKKIHYCWFGGAPLPSSARHCINSWKQYLPDYEIIEWNESNFDVNMIPYISEAYNEKKYAYVSDLSIPYINDHLDPWIGLSPKAHLWDMKSQMKIKMNIINIT